MPGPTVSSSAYMSTPPPPPVSGAVSSSPPCLSRHDRTSPWPVTPPAGRFGPTSSRHVQPHLLHYLVQQHQQAAGAAGSLTGYAGSRPSTAGASSVQAPSSPSSSSTFYHHHHGRAVGPSHPAASHHAKPSTDWRCGLRPSGAVSFRTVVDADDSRSTSATAEDHHHSSSYQPRQPSTRTANVYHHARLI